MKNNLETHFSFQSFANFSIGELKYFNYKKSASFKVLKNTQREKKALILNEQGKSKKYQSYRKIKN